MEHSANEHPNAARVRQLFAAFVAATWQPSTRCSPRKQPGTSPGVADGSPGDHRGRDAILAFLLNVQALSDGTFHLQLIDVLANDAHAVALFRGHARRDGKRLGNPTCLHMRLARWPVQEVWELVWDLYRVDDSWS